MIVFQNVDKNYGKHNVLKDLSFSISGGDMVSIVGASGVGKTTIVKLLIGAESPDKGKVLVDDVDLRNLSSSLLQLYRRHIGIVYQDYKLLPNKTVFENVAYAQEVCGETNDAIKTIVPKVLHLVNLVGMDNKFPSTLSGGEKQRVALARALVHRPKLLIADEPTGNLDPKNTAEIVDLMKTINEMGTTVIITTHDPDVVNSLKRRVIHMENGQMVSDVAEGSYVG